MFEKTDKPRRKKQKLLSIFRSCPHTARIYRQTSLHPPAVKADSSSKILTEQNGTDTTAITVFFSGSPKRYLLKKV